MLLPEDRLELLLERLRALPARDRRAILRRLSAEERRLLARRSMGKIVERPGDEKQGLSPEMAERIARLKDGGGMRAGVTQATAETLARLVSPADPAKSSGRHNQASLADTLGGFLGRGPRR